MVAVECAFSDDKILPLERATTLVVLMIIREPLIIVN